MIVFFSGSDGQSKRSLISVKFDILGLRMRAPGDLTDDEFDEAKNALKDISDKQMKMNLAQLELISEALRESSVGKISQCLAYDDDLKNRSDKLKEKIRDYFKQETVICDVSLTNVSIL